MTSNAPKDLSSKKPETKRFYFLVSGTVAFYAKNAAPEGVEPEVGSLPLNAVVATDNGQFPTSALANAQVALTQALQDKIGHAQAVEIVDVQLTNICKLGHMLPSEFHDLKAQPTPEPTAEDVAPAKVV